MVGKNMKCFTNISIKYLLISVGQKIEHYVESGKFNKEICIVVTGQKSKVKSWPSVLLTFEIKNLIFYCQKMKNPTGILVEVFDNWSEDLGDEMREINKISTESVMLVVEDFYWRLGWRWRKAQMLLLLVLLLLWRALGERGGRGWVLAPRLSLDMLDGMLSLRRSFVAWHTFKLINKLGYRLAHR